MGRIYGYNTTADVPGTGAVTLVTTTTLPVLLAATDHGIFSGLGDDDHTQYILVDGSRSFTNPVGGVTPTTSAHLTTKGYVDGLDHGVFSGLSDDDHTQYLLADGTRELSADWDAGSFKITAETFESDIATGTAPLAVASTTLVNNLNADLLDGNEEISLNYQQRIIVGFA